MTPMTEAEILLLYATYGLEGLLEQAPLDVREIVRGAAKNPTISEVSDADIVACLSVAEGALFRKNGYTELCLRLSGIYACVAVAAPAHKARFEYGTRAVDHTREGLLHAATYFAQSAADTASTSNPDSRQRAYSRACMTLLRRWSVDYATPVPA